MIIQVRYFASIREAIGCGHESVQTHANDVGELLVELRSRGAAHAGVLAEGRPVRVAVNQVMAATTTRLHAGAEVGFFPPVTGG